MVRLLRGYKARFSDVGSGAGVIEGLAAVALLPHVLFFSEGNTAILTFGILKAHLLQHTDAPLSCASCAFLSPGNRGKVLFMESILGAPGHLPLGHLEKIGESIADVGCKKKSLYEVHCGLRPKVVLHPGLDWYAVSDWAVR